VRKLQAGGNSFSDESVTGLAQADEKTSNMETGCDTLPRHESYRNFKPLNLKGFKKLARALLYLWYKNKKKCDTQ
jgi:hypothetical protein